MLTTMTRTRATAAQIAARCAARIEERSEREVELREVYEFARKLIVGHHKTIGWMSTAHDPMQINLRHTIPGSFGEELDGTFDEVREAIRSRRIYINEAEAFRMPETSACTVEVRLTDTSRTMPNAFFHAIVCFSGGEKTVLTNFGEVFRAAGMDYML